MSTIEIYTKPHCPYCHRAKAVLDIAGASYREFDVSNDASRLTEMLERSQRRTVPQIFIGDRHLGGSDELVEAKQNGRLRQLLANCSSTQH